MPISTKQKPGRGIPRKTRNLARKNKHNRYLAKASCFRCKLVFRSPKYNRAHAKSNHIIITGVNRLRSYPGSSSL